MQMLLIVLNRVEKLNPLLDALMERGIGGATILKSDGMIKVLAKNIENYPILGSLRHIIQNDEERKSSRTIFMVLPEDRIEGAKETVRTVVGDLSEPDSAIMLTLPILSVEGVEF
jgi:hypothetical protein